MSLGETIWKAFFNQTSENITYPKATGLLHANKLCLAISLANQSSLFERSKKYLTSLNVANMSLGAIAYASQDLLYKSNALDYTNKLLTDPNPDVTSSLAKAAIASGLAMGISEGYKLLKTLKNMRPCSVFYSDFSKKLNEQRVNVKISSSQQVLIQEMSNYYMKNKGGELDLYKNWINLDQSLKEASKDEVDVLSNNATKIIQTFNLGEDFALLCACLYAAGNDKSFVQKRKRFIKRVFETNNEEFTRLFAGAFSEVMKFVETLKSTLKYKEEMNIVDEQYKKLKSFYFYYTDFNKINVDNYLDHSGIPETEINDDLYMKNLEEDFKNLGAHLRLMCRSNSQKSCCQTFKSPTYLIKEVEKSLQDKVKKEFEVKFVFQKDKGDPDDLFYDKEYEIQLVPIGRKKRKDENEEDSIRIKRR